jgi:hypothetical protein
MASIIKANELQDFGGNSIITSDGAGNVTVNAAAMKMTPAFQANLSAGYSISDNSLTKVNFDTEVFDTDSCYDNTTNYRFTPTISGKYYCFSSLILYANGPSTINRTELRIRKNGSDQYTTINEFDSNPIQFNTIFGGEIIEFNGSTDYVEVYGLVDSTGGTQSIYSSSPFTSTFGAYKLIGA